MKYYTISILATLGSRLNGIEKNSTVILCGGFTDKIEEYNAYQSAYFRFSLGLEDQIAKHI